MIKSVVRQHHWHPKDIDVLYIDRIDHHGLEYWYDDAVEMTDEIEKKIKGK
jgi:hypothetical protein